jgi:hypothetical protein
MPFSRGAPFLLALAPFSNAYGGAAATTIVLLRWAVLELPSKSLPRPVLIKVGLAIGFLAGAVTISGFVTDDLMRLASESAQWIIGIGWFCALVIGGDEEHERLVILGTAAGGIALTLAHVLMRAFQTPVDEFAVMPFMLTYGNNYAALFALVALVILPAHPAAHLATPSYVVLASLGLLMTLMEEARSQTAVGAGVILAVVLLRHFRPRFALTLVVFGGSAVIVAMLWFLRDSLYSNASVISLVNFQTNFSNLERLGLLIHSVVFFAAHPFGAGIGASSDIFPSSPFTIHSYPSPHNTFALMIVEIGWWGFIAYVVGVACLIRNGVRDCLAGNPFGIAALAAVAVSVLDAMFFNGSVSLVFWLLLAFVARDTDANRGRIPMVFYRTA